MVGQSENEFRALRVGTVNERVGRLSHDFIKKKELFFSSHLESNLFIKNFNHLKVSESFYSQNSN